MSVLITGAAGFVGGWMLDLLHRRLPEARLFGLVRKTAPSAHAGFPPEAITWTSCDLEDAAATQAALAELRPELIFHLAAQSSVPQAFQAPAATLGSNILGLVNLLEAVRATRLNSKIILAGSSECYGMSAVRHIPVTETTPFQPANPYAVSKATQDLLGWQYFHAYGMHIVRMRPFNHSGPGRSDAFVESNFARQIARIEAGLEPPRLLVGNLDARRDFLDVRDVTEAYLAAATHGVPGEAYNVASGVARSVRDVLDHLLSLTAVPIEVVVDPKRLRPSDVPIIQGDATKFQALCGWQARIPFEQTLEELLDFWRRQEGSV